MIDYELTGVVGDALRRWPIPQGETRIGRNAELAVSLADRSVSREHALLVRDADALHLTDLGSRNGTSVNGDRIQKAHALRAGDSITFGNVTLVLQGSEQVLQPSLTEHARLDSTVKLAWNDLRAAPPPSSSGRVSLFDVISDLGEFLVLHQPPQAVYDACLAAVDKIVPFQRACLLLLDAAGEPVLKAARYKGVGANAALALSRTIVDTVIHERASLLVQDAMADPRFNVAQSVILEQIRSALVVPLFDNTNVIGVLYADTRELVTPYREEHLRQLAWLANILAVKISNAQLLEAKRDQERMQQEIATAVRIQRSMLVQDLPCPSGYELCARLEPSTEVGGDLYDVRDLGGGKYALVLGDVVGHGVGAALLMATALSAVRALAGELDDPVRIVEKVHTQIYETTDATSYLTLFLAILDSQTHVLEWVNAGHQEAPALLSADGTVERLESTGPPVGLLPIARYESNRVTVPEGALLATWSDGIPEAHLPTEDEAEPPTFFGDTVSMLDLMNGDDQSVAGIATHIFARVDAFLTGAKAPDDRTLLLLRRLG
jgi:serine phosphatase RsbU (regulator of sigma subunit)/pSer/pThr/pTyr-binding forkhead associated (FHA) protein